MEVGQVEGSLRTVPALGCHSDAFGAREKRRLDGIRT